MDHITRYRENHKHRLMLESENLELIEDLLKQGVSPGQMSNAVGQSPLIAASAKKTRLLIKYGVNVNEKDAFGRTALHFADAEKAEILLKSGSLFDENVAKKVLIETLIDGNKSRLSAQQKIEKIKVLQKFGLVLQTGLSNNKNALFYTNEEEVIDFLISEGVDYNALDELGQNVFFSNNLSSSLIFKYAKLGVSVNRKNKEGIPPICCVDNVYAIKAMLGCGAELSGFYFDLSNPHPLLRSDFCKKDKEPHAMIIDIYHSKGLDFSELFDKRGRTPLFFVDSLASVKKLKSYGVNINHKNDKEETAIIQYAKNKDMLISFIHEGADLNVFNKSGQALIHLVKTKSLSALKKVNYNMNTLNKHGENAYFSLKDTPEDLNKFKKLLNLKVDIHQVSKKTGLSVLESLPPKLLQYYNTQNAKKEKDILKNEVKVDKKLPKSRL